MNNMKIFSGESNSPLVAKVCERLNVPVGKITLKTFPSGERYCQFEENIRGTDLFLVQSLSSPVNDYLMELLVMCDTARRASAGRITAVIPYFGYSRQDRKERSRVPISAKLVMDLLESAGVKRILTMDLHAPQIGGFTNLPVDHLTFKPTLLNAIKDLDIQVVVAPDIGGVKKAEEFTKNNKLDLCIVCKKRNSETNVEVTNFIGDVKDKNVLILDDLTESCGTLIEAAKECLGQGARTIYAAVTHGCFSEMGRDRIDVGETDLIEKIFYSNTILNEGKTFDPSSGMIEVDVSELFSSAIQKIHNNESVSGLFT